jgi:hypothetical protein
MMRGEAGRFDVLIAGLAGVASVVLVIGTLAVEQIRVTHEIQVWAPTEVQGEDRVPVRARVLADLESADGPRIVVPDVSVAAVSEDELDAASLRGQLTPAALDTLEGEAPSESTDVVFVQALGPSGAQLATATRTMTRVATARPRPVQARVADGLQVLSLARPPELEAALPELDVRVEGGVCVPEHPCRLWFWRGASEAVPRLSECTPMEPGEAHVGQALVSIDVVVHGPEARCHVTFEPLAVGTELQLPVGLATPWIEVSHDAQAALLTVTGEPPLGRDAMLIDVHVGNRWVLARSMRRDEALTIDEGLLEGHGFSQSIGVVRVQARADVASSERAHQRAVFVPFEAEGDAPRPTTDLDRDLEAMLGAGWRREGERAEAERWAMLQLETELVAVPEPVSGFVRDEARLADVRTRMRLFCAIGVLFGIGAILGAIARRGLASAREARAVMVEAGAEHADDRGARWRSWLTVAGFVCAIALAILLGAAFLVARPYFMG